MWKVKIKQIWKNKTYHRHDIRYSNNIKHWLSFISHIFCWNLCPLKSIDGIQNAQSYKTLIVKVRNSEPLDSFLSNLKYSQFHRWKYWMNEWFLFGSNYHFFILHFLVNCTFQNTILKKKNKTAILWTYRGEVWRKHHFRFDSVTC